MDLSIFSSVDSWIALLTLTVLEIVLGIDNIVFISILTGKLPANQQNKARQLGLGLAMITRILLLLSISWVMSLTNPLFDLGKILGIESEKYHEALSISGRDLILLVGGLFLLYKATHEIHDKLEGNEEEALADGKQHSFGGTIVQILLLDIVFSLDSVITAVGMADHIIIMIMAVVISVCIMLFAAKGISDFVNNHPTVKMLALSFLILIAVSLLAEGLDQPIPKGYVYFAMFFSVAVEMLNLRMKKKSEKKAIPNVPTKPDAAEIK